MDRAWGICIANENSNIIGIGYDEGTIVIKMGNDEPIASMKFLIYNFNYILIIKKQWKTTYKQKFRNFNDKFKGS